MESNSTDYIRVSVNRNTLKLKGVQQSVTQKIIYKIKSTHSIIKLLYYSDLYTQNKVVPASTLFLLIVALIHCTVYGFKK